MASVVTGGEDGNGLKVEKISNFFHVLNCKLCLGKFAENIMVKVCSP